MYKINHRSRSRPHINETNERITSTIPRQSSSYSYGLPLIGGRVDVLNSNTFASTHFIVHSRQTPPGSSRSAWSLEHPLCKMYKGGIRGLWTCNDKITKKMLDTILQLHEGMQANYYLNFQFFRLWQARTEQYSTSLCKVSHSQHYPAVSVYPALKTNANNWEMVSVEKCPVAHLFYAAKTQSLPIITSKYLATHRPKHSERLRLESTQFAVNST